MPEMSKPESLMAPPHCRCKAQDSYWVLQSPSLLWAVFTFFNSFCSSDSAAMTSFGF